MEEVGGGRFRTAGEIADWIESKYGVHYKGNSIYSLLQRLRCSPKVPRPRHEKAERGRLRSPGKKGGSGVPFGERELSSGTLIGFADEMRVGLRGMVRRVWGVRGVKVVQRLQLVYEWKIPVPGGGLYAWQIGVGVDGLDEVGDGGARGSECQAMQGSESAGVGRSAEPSQRVGEEYGWGEDDSTASVQS